MRKLTLMISLLLMVSTAYAEGPKAPKPKTPVNSVDGILFPKGQVGIILKNVSMSKDGLYKGDEELPNTKAKDITKTVLAVRYGLIDNVELKLKVPYFTDYDLARPPKASIGNDGFGDVMLHGRYQFLSPKRGDDVFLFGGIGLKMPTGETGSQTNGTLDPPTMQVGSGSWDPILDLGITKAMGSLKLNGFVSYTMTTEGDNDYQWGDQLLTDVSAVYALNKHFDFELEINGIWKDQNENKGVEVGNTGGDQIYLTPGVHFKFMKKSHLAIGVPITIYRDLHGPQLSEDYRVVAKLAFVF
jgi:outer membrane putative beta-barrel porin/alpha-amylase